MMHEYIILSVDTICSRCGRALHAGERVRVFWSVKDDGWIHSHIGRVGCGRNRIADKEKAE